MANLAAIPIELNFIHQLLGDRGMQYRQAFWLKNAFEHDIWECHFEGCNKNKIIDFRITFPDGTKLTDQKHAILLDIFKCFLCVQTHSDTSEGMKLCGTSAYIRVNIALKLIDYFLLNLERYPLHQHGFISLTESDITSVLLEIGSHRESHQGIYRWRDRLRQFLKEKTQALDSKIIASSTAAFPLLKENGVPQNEWKLGLSAAELVKARVWLYLNEFYHRIGSDVGGFRKAPNNAKLAKLIYANTLAGKNTTLPKLPELGIESATYTTREYLAVAVHAKGNKHMNGSTFSGYCQALRYLGLLDAIDLPVPIQVLKTIKQPILMELLKFNQPGRVHTLPCSVVFTSLRKAVEFGLTYGEGLVDSYLAIIKASHANNKTLCQWLRKDKDITPYLTPAIRHLGIQRWTIHQHDEKSFKRIDNATYYSCLRANEGLWELLRVLYGAIQIVIGTLMARRQGELTDLIATKCLDKDKRYLIFFVRKSGYDGKRERVARPIPKIAVTFIQLLERLQITLKKHDMINEYHSLFSYPPAHGKGLVTLCKLSFNQSTNFFCDYMETPLNHEGKRYYIRQHQLRRFFAMLFFWGSSFGGMDTLRWFLGHADVEHLYHYITESTPGGVLRGTQAHYATEQLQAYHQSTNELADLLEKRYGTRKFDLMDASELNGYIEELIEEGNVTVKPEFFKAADGKDYRVLITVSKDTRNS